MTFSIVASNPSTKELCVATTTGLVAVGNLVPSIYPNVGAICIQAMVKPSNRENILLLQIYNHAYPRQHSLQQLMLTKDVWVKKHLHCLKMLFS